MGKSVKATQTEHTPAYQPIHAAVSVASEIRTAATSGRKQNDSEDDESEGHDVELEREARAMGTVCSTHLGATPFLHMLTKSIPVMCLCQLSVPDLQDR